MAARAALLSALVPALLAGCVQNEGERFNPIKDALSVSEDEERELGLEFDLELHKHVKVIEDPIVAGFINDLGQEIVKTIEPQPFVYRFRIVQDASLNAFAVPGGYVYFHSGTVMAAGSMDELAGVMGHEIAHVKAHHYARMRQKSQIPDLLTQLAGIAVAVATGEPGAMVAAQAANVAVQLKFSREFETEADQLGSVFMTRAGYEPAAITRFFERIMAVQKDNPLQIPPYLYSHPDVEKRISAVEKQAESLTPTRAPDPRFDDLLSEVQGRLAYLMATDRESVPPGDPPKHPEQIDPLLRRADDLAQEGRADEALIVLARAEALEPRDPRAPFQIGELLGGRGRHREAVAAYRRALRLDSSRALVFYKLGLSHKALGERHIAVHAFEQASNRAGATSTLRKRADWQIETQIFPVLVETGFADGTRGAGETPLGHERLSFAGGTLQMAWWGRVHSRYSKYPDKMSVRWLGPSGRVVAESDVDNLRRPYVGSVLTLEEPGAAGTWQVEALYDDTVIERWSVQVHEPR